MKPILTEEVVANVEKKKKNNAKKEGQKAFLGFKKAQELLKASQKVKPFTLLFPAYIYFCNREKLKN